MGKSYKCNKLETTIHFLPDAVKFCCSCAEGPGLKTTNVNTVNLKKAEAKRQSIINSLMRGKIPYECKGCTDYCEQAAPSFKELIFGVKNTKKINNIIINNFKECDCDCVYCTQKLIYPGETKKYDVLPFIRELYLNNSLSKDFEVEIQGGSVGVWSEYQQVLTELSKINCKKYIIQTNGIKYEPILEEIAKNASVTVTVSLDCGTKEKFAEIKKSDKFDTVIENICKYARSGINIQMKYIMLEGINDNIEEITKFLDTARAFGCIAFFDLDYRKVYFGNFDRYVLPENFKTLAESIKKYESENNITVYFNNAFQEQLDKASK